ncbi:MT-A70-domain-containing protein [Cokeromyces recurvatus]|uniref:MT-A70-domain-containing protein n=1 Tax=Cokeromyces recurvatus TaxID=90255 RepID=UPI00221F8C08|nr:MT-A70-domain-containing protein [Cokeromyces recurvatus]KAI7906800.1 MT-A70-domain-containing protein [Cokeromyces recurvatus]
MFDIIDSEKCLSKGILPYELRKGEFDVFQPYFRAKRKLSIDEKEESLTTNKKRRKKNKNKHEEYVSSNVTDVETKKRHETLRSQLMACLEQLPLHWPAHWKNRIDTSTSLYNTLETETIDFPSIQQMVEAAQQKFTDKDEDQTKMKEFEFTSNVTKELDIFSIFNIICINRSTNVKLLEMTPTSSYLIPPNSSFLMGSMNNSLHQLTAYIDKLGGADIIVMDPPWPNKSVQRSSTYATQDIYDLFSIPIPKMMLSKDCIVAVWVTNKPKFRNFIIHKLFPAWQLECISEWIWLKTTTQDSTHKKPYEQLIIGRPIQYKDSQQRISIPKTHTIVSIPSVRHSRKPPLQGKNEDKVNPVCVELFARCLYPGWINWGNECLKFQHLNYFVNTEKGTK